MVTEVPIPPGFRLAETIYKLYQSDFIYTTGEMCDLAKATVWTIASKICTVIKIHYGTIPSSVIFQLQKTIFGIVWENLAKNGNFPVYLQLPVVHTCL